jgi:hypothetical protein
MLVWAVFYWAEAQSVESRPGLCAGAVGLVDCREPSPQVMVEDLVPLGGGGGSSAGAHMECMTGGTQAARARVGDGEHAKRGGGDRCFDLSL